jgi:menaquinone-dependent protoporphyrinogen oxidase
MRERLLIAYGSKHGSTAETADAIAGMLRERGLEVDVSEASRVKSLEGYDRVVVGGSIYMGRWHADARDFVKRFGAELSAIPVAIFAMGPKTSEPDDLAASREQLDANLRKLPDVGADPIAIFGGVINPAKLRFPFSRMPATDARDWQEIEAYAAAAYSGSALPQETSSDSRSSHVTRSAAGSGLLM